MSSTATPLFINSVLGCRTERLTMICIDYSKEKGSSVSVITVFISVVPTITPSIRVRNSVLPPHPPPPPRPPLQGGLPVYIYTWCRCVAPLGDRTIHTNAPTIQFQSICPFLSLPWVIYSLEINESISSGSSSSLVMNHTAATQWSHHWVCTLRGSPCCLYVSSC